MYKIPLKNIKEKIIEKTGLSEKEINTKIKDKMDILSGLISEEGAAHILANELGVKLYDETEKLKIKNILSGMRNVEIEAKIIKIYEMKEFNKNNKKGKIISFLVGDETALIRVVAWNDKVDLLTNLKENDTIRIENAYAKENNGKIELHIGEKSKIIKIDTIIEIKERKTDRKKIIELKDGDENIEILGIIVNVFDLKFFEVCKECGKRLKNDGNNFFCDVHGIVEPNYSYVLNLILDDNTETIRVVLWKNQIQNLLKMTEEEILAKRNESFEDIKTDLLGRFLKLIGRVNKNIMYERLEFIPSLVFIDPNPEEELEKLKNENEKLSKNIQNEKQYDSDESNINLNNMGNNNLKTNEKIKENEKNNYEPLNKNEQKQNIEENDDDLLEEINNLDDLEI